MLFPLGTHCQCLPRRAQITAFHCRLLVSARGHSSVNLPHPLEQEKKLPILPFGFLFNYHSCFLIWENPSFLYLISLSRSYYSASCNTNYYASCMPARLMSYIKDGEFWNLQKEIQHECDANRGDTSIFQTKENHSPSKSFLLPLCPLQLLFRSRHFVAAQRQSWRRAPQKKQTANMRNGAGHRWSFSSVQHPVCLSNE